MASDSISLARWWRAFCAGDIVSQASLTEMSTFVGGPGSYGLGLSDEGSDYGVSGVGVGKLGSNFGYISAAWCLTDEDPVIFAELTNWRSGHGPDLAIPLVLAALSE